MERLLLLLLQQPATRGRLLIAFDSSNVCFSSEGGAGFSLKLKGGWGLTALFGHASGDVDEDAGVAEDHDDQRQQEEAGEGEHVVGCFL